MSDFNRRPLLVVDDSKDDVELLKRALRKSGWANPVIDLRDGEEAIEFLIGRLEAGKSEWNSLPVAVLTDLKMPRGDGFQLLAWIREQAVLEQVVRVVVTNSRMDADIEKAFGAGADFFLTKPADFNDFVMFSTNLLAWLRLNRFRMEPPSDASWSAIAAARNRPPILRIEENFANLRARP